MQALTNESLNRLGSRKWDGSLPRADETFTLAGREVQLDSKVSKQEVPAIAGRALEENHDIEMMSSPSTPVILSSSRSLNTTPATSAPSDSPSESTSVKSVSAKSFYAHAKPKPKIHGPL